MAAKCRRVTRLHVCMRAVHVPTPATATSPSRRRRRHAARSDRATTTNARVDDVFLEGDVVDRIDPRPTNLRHPSKLSYRLPRMRFSHVTTARCRTNPIRSDRKQGRNRKRDKRERERDHRGGGSVARERGEQSKGFGVRPSIVDLQKSITLSCRQATDRLRQSTRQRRRRRRPRRRKAVTDLRSLQAWKTTTETGEGMN